MVSRRRTNLVLLVICVFILCFTISLFGSSQNNLELSFYKAGGLLGSNYQGEWRSCKPLDHIFFLKLHKCGSSTVQNILMRRGLCRNLNFVLPEKANYLGHPEPFDRSHIGFGMMDNLEHFDIFTHHSRFDADGVRSVMPADTKKVTILREPSSLFESLYNYYHFNQMFKNETIDLALLLEKLEIDDLVTVFENVPRLAYRISYNQMAFDFGFTKNFFRNEIRISELIKMIDEEFDLVLISEYMEASMVLLADMMCWPLEEVTFLKLNARPEDTHHTLLSAKDKMKIRQLNNVDSAIYDHFREKFKQRVKAYGEERMQADVSRLVDLNQSLMEECVAVVVKPKGNLTKALYPVTVYQLYENAPSYCREMNMGELKFTEILRNRQKIKFATKLKIDALMKT